MFDIANIVTTLLSIPAVLIALTVHEYAHGYAAWRLGDPTARSLGRLTLNPLKHIDPIGALCMVFFRFGWAKPVPINSRYFKKPRRDMALTALAGPLANFIMALLGALLYAVAFALFNSLAARVALSGFILRFLNYTLDFLWIFHFLNITLGLFNCIPIPPLDGSRVLYVFLPPRLYFGVMRYERYIAIAMLLLLYFGVFTGFLMGAATWISGGMFQLVWLIPGLS